ncbi:MAG: hypothetical protein QOF02_3655, partial [Blastocatellia bacterium]|nr:hypothetical protein [Blastocatellia bacterium]
MKDKKDTQPLSIYPRRSEPQAGGREASSEALQPEQELSLLLKRWNAPATPSSLENRLLSVYRQEFKRAPFWKRLFGARVPVQQGSVPSREEIFMKQCSTCHEEFANKFSFCPVDGTPLNELAAAIVASPPIVAPVASDDEAQTLAAIPTYNNPEYHLTIMEDAGITRRLAQQLSAVKHQSQLTWPEFKRDPAGFTRRMASGYGSS